jgi:hypothetical protein
MRLALLACLLLCAALHSEDAYITLTTAELRAGVSELVTKAYPTVPAAGITAELDKSLPPTVLLVHVHTGAAEDLPAMRAYANSRLAVFRQIGKSLDKYTALLADAGVDNLDRRQLVVLMRLIARQDDEIASLLAK